MGDWLKNRTCGACRFFYDDEAPPKPWSPDAGQCRRYPPARETFNADDEEDGGWPLVAPKMVGCGEWQPDE